MPDPVTPGAKFTIILRDSVRGDGWSETWHASTATLTVDQTIALGKEYAKLRDAFLSDNCTIQEGRAASDINKRLGFPFSNPVGYNLQFGGRQPTAEHVAEFSWDALDVLFPLVGGRRKLISIRGASQGLLENLGEGWSRSYLTNNGFVQWLLFAQANLSVACRATRNDVPGTVATTITVLSPGTALVTLFVALNPFSVGQRVHLYAPRNLRIPVGDHYVHATDVQGAASPNIQIAYDPVRYPVQTGTYPGLIVQPIVPALYSIAPLQFPGSPAGIPVFIRVGRRKSGRDPIPRPGRSRRRATVA